MISHAILYILSIWYHIWANPGRYLSRGQRLSGGSEWARQGPGRRRQRNAAGRLPPESAQGNKTVFPRVTYDITYDIMYDIICDIISILWYHSLCYDITCYLWYHACSYDIMTNTMISDVVWHHRWCMILLLVSGGDKAGRLPTESVQLNETVTAFIQVTQEICFVIRKLAQMAER